MLAHTLAALLLAAPAPEAGPRAPPRPPSPARLSELRLDAFDAALGGRFGRLFAVAGRMLEQAPLDGDAYRMAGDAALLGGRVDEARRLLAKAQLIAPLDCTERLLQALAVPAGPRLPEEPPAPPPDRLRALAWLDLAENRHLAVPRFTCAAAARALEAQPDEARALAIRARLKCPAEPEAGAPAPRSERLGP
ncbi:MAG TPA: hypothetical protein VFP50_05020 [Anaeromyxobacteraceae bacterium]|nr:hypothetical protein [Anaeromyxobacteraceae bacterium]